MALFVDLVALSNGLHGSVQMDWVAPPPWNIHLGKFLKDLNLDTLKNELNNKNYARLATQQNMYILTIPKLKEDSNVEIEDLFDEELLNIELNGKNFSRSGKDDNSFGKEIFSKYVYSHRDKIDFSNFKYILNGIRDILVDYSQSMK